MTVTQVHDGEGREGRPHPEGLVVDSVVDIVNGPQLKAALCCPSDEGGPQMKAALLPLQAKLCMSEPGGNVSAAVTKVVKKMSLLPKIEGADGTPVSIPAAARVIDLCDDSPTLSAKGGQSDRYPSRFESSATKHLIPSLIQDASQENVAPQPAPSSSWLPNGGADGIWFEVSGHSGRVHLHLAR